MEQWSRGSGTFSLPFRPGQAVSHPTIPHLPYHTDISILLLSLYYLLVMSTLRVALLVLDQERSRFLDSQKFRSE